MGKYKSLRQLTNESVDRGGYNPIVRTNRNRNLSTNEIYRRIEQRNHTREPTAQLRQELYRRTGEY
jgi:hypothetical protein